MNAERSPHLYDVEFVTWWIQPSRTFFITDQGIGVTHYRNFPCSGCGKRAGNFVFWGGPIEALCRECRNASLNEDYGMTYRRDPSRTPPTIRYLSHECSPGSTRSSRSGCLPLIRSSHDHPRLGYRQPLRVERPTQNLQNRFELSYIRHRVERMLPKEAQS